MTRRPPLDTAQRDRLNTACEQVADLLETDPENVFHDGTHICLSVNQVHRLLTRYRAAGPDEALRFITGIAPDGSTR